MRSLQQLSKNMLSQAKKQPEPFFIHTLGGPCSGKSFLTKQLTSILVSHNPVYIGWDHLMEQLPEYQAIDDKKAAFEAFEKPVLEKGYELLGQLIDKQVNIIFEHSGAREDHLDILNRAKYTKGYRIIIVPLFHPIELAKKWVEERNQKGHRYTPLSYVEERAKILEALEPRYQMIADHLIKKHEDNSMDDVVEQIAGVLR